MSESYFAVLDSDSLDPPLMDISCIFLSYDVSFGSIDISCLEPMDLSWNIIDISCNSAIWFHLDVSFDLMDRIDPNFISMDISYALENNRMVLFSHELSDEKENDK